MDVRSLSLIAAEIEANWPKVSPYARDYLDAMKTLDKVTDSYYADSGKSIVLYFLSNASSFRGEAARRLKAELKSMVA
jgi:hypothetical protein